MDGGRKISLPYFSFLLSFLLFFLPSFFSSLLSPSPPFLSSSVIFHLKPIYFIPACVRHCARHLRQDNEQHSTKTIQGSPSVVQKCQALYNLEFSLFPLHTSGYLPHLSQSSTWNPLPISPTRLGFRPSLRCPFPPITMRHVAVICCISHIPP